MATGVEYLAYLKVWKIWHICRSGSFGISTDVSTDFVKSTFVQRKKIYVLPLCYTICPKKEEKILDYTYASLFSLYTHFCTHVFPNFTSLYLKIGLKEIRIADDLRRTT